ncbi:MAG: phosphatase PAP2 family protein [Chitinophagales bacterium]|nr:MAG: phosphatase PAP2 family protein [Chitinophagales bacterium]
MTDWLLQLDKELFTCINVKWTSPLLDSVLPWMRNKYVWAPLYLFIGSFLLLNYHKKGLLISIYLALTVLLCDQISSDLIKPLLARPRPCHHTEWLEEIRVLVSCGTGYSFVSSHATNHFGVALFLGLLLKKKFSWVLPVGLIWALLIAYSQIYVGVHYPLDIAGGALLGAAIGSLMYGMVYRHLKGDF